MGLTGNFWDLKREEIRRKLPEALELYPAKLVTVTKFSKTTHLRQKWRM
ncbi:hypothetical protein [Ferroglobus placidus]|nr:hypothetical protein [Ferroglobus placidus]